MKIKLLLLIDALRELDVSIDKGAYDELPKGDVEDVHELQHSLEVKRLAGHKFVDVF